MEAVMERPQTRSAEHAAPFQPEPSIKDRTIKAAKLYLEKRGYVVSHQWESDSQLGFIAEDEGTLAFVHVVSNGLDKKRFPEESTMTREKFEQAAISWLSEHDHAYKDMRVRFDELALTVLCKDKALIKHHVNVWGVQQPLD